MEAVDLRVRRRSSAIEAQLDELIARAENDAKMFARSAAHVAELTDTLLGDLSRLERRACARFVASLKDDPLVMAHKDAPLDEFLALIASRMIAEP